jgi:hypothetical protein
MMTNKERKLVWKKGRKIKGKEIKELLQREGNKIRNDLVISDYFTCVETDNGNLFNYWREFDHRTNSYPDHKMRGWYYESIDDYLTLRKDSLELSKQPPQSIIVPHNHYFKMWDASGATYIQDLLTVIPVKPELLDFSPESLLAIDKVIKRKKLPDDLFEGSLFLPAVVGYCSVHLARYQQRKIEVEYHSADDVYDLYYMNGKQKEALYGAFYWEATERPSKFSLDFIIDVNFF